MAGPRSVGLDAVGGPAGESEGVGGITPIGNAWIAIGEDGWVRRRAGRPRPELSLRDPHRPKRRKESGEKDS